MDRTTEREGTRKPVKRVSKGYADQCVWGGGMRMREKGKKYWVNEKAVERQGEKVKRKKGGVGWVERKGNSAFELVKVGPLFMFAVGHRGRLAALYHQPPLRSSMQ